MRVPLPEFAGSVLTEVVVFEVDDAFAVLFVLACGAVASAWAARIPTPAKAASVIVSTENVAPRPDLRGARAPRGAPSAGAAGAGSAPCLRAPAARVPLPMGAIMPYRHRTG